MFADYAESLICKSATLPMCHQHSAYFGIRHNRHTHATRHLQDGIDIRTLQQWMGHRDIASTMVYLKGVRDSDVQAQINKGSLAAFA
jgi:site-specific recombinase XerD